MKKSCYSYIKFNCYEKIMYVTKASSLWKYSNSGIVKGCLVGPRPSQLFTVALPQGLRYSNKTVKYSNKAVSRPGGTLPNY